MGSLYRVFSSFLDLFGKIRNYISMIILREADRKDKDSEEAFYEIETGNPDEEISVKDGKFSFVWHRKKSNSNVKEKGFSFYYARHAYKDKYKLIDPDFASDSKNTGILGMIPGNTNKMILIYAQTDYLERGITRIVSAYYTTNRRLIAKYDSIKTIRKRHESLGHDEGGNPEQMERVRKIIESHEKLHPLQIFDN